MTISLPKDFVPIHVINGSIIESVRYASDHNFIGKPIPGYKVPHVWLTEKAAIALSNVQREVQTKGYNLLVYDGYRPCRAVRAFVEWAQDLDDTITKYTYYPTMNKKDLIGRYIAERSSHSRGSTVDLTLIRHGVALQPPILIRKTLREGLDVPFLMDGSVDMGTHFDFFHEASHHNSIYVEADQTEKRNFLHSIMNAHGFSGYDKEWWHYSLRDEPYPDTYFDSDISA
jgi:D-alanyl-D-alanine dipeptidase